MDQLNFVSSSEKGDYPQLVSGEDLNLRARSCTAFTVCSSLLIAFIASLRMCTPCLAGTRRSGNKPPRPFVQSAANTMPVAMLPAKCPLMRTHASAQLSLPLRQRHRQPAFCSGYVLALKVPSSDLSAGQLSIYFALLLCMQETALVSYGEGC